MAKKKLICLLSFIMIFLIRGIVYSQYMPYQGKRVITTAAGFNIKLNITCSYDDPVKREDIADGLIDLPPFIVTHAKLELHDHKPLEQVVYSPKNYVAGAVFPPPALYNYPCLQQSIKDLSVEQLIPKFSLEGLHISVRPRTSGLNEQCADSNFNTLFSMNSWMHIYLT